VDSADFTSNQAINNQSNYQFMFYFIFTCDAR